MAEGLPPDTDLDQLFGFEPLGRVNIEGLGWCEGGFAPRFPEALLEDRGRYELVQDVAGRSALYFKGRRNGFMPEYVDHPVKGRKLWEEKCLWRMDPKTPSRRDAMVKYMPAAVEGARKAMLVSQWVVGGYMFLRSLMGPEGVLYMFYDDPQLIHMCMEQWLFLADHVIAEHRKYVSIDELFIGEKICYNQGCLISPGMVCEFLLPYYQQLLHNMQLRQLDPQRHVGFQVDSDGNSETIIDLYRSAGMNHMSPFEAAAHTGVIRVGQKYPDLRISGGIDKRVLATTKDEIDHMVDRIYPVMKARGGYIPTCDHVVPEEVSLENYMHFRKRCLEFS